MWFLCCRIWYGATVVCCTCSWVLHLCCTTLATGPKRILPPRDAYGIECPRGKACQWLILTKSVHSLEPWGATERKRTFSNNSNNFFLDFMFQYVPIKRNQRKCDLQKMICKELTRSLTRPLSRRYKRAESWNMSTHGEHFEAAGSHHKQLEVHPNLWYSGFRTVALSPPTYDSTSQRARPNPLGN
jgi:hypothetical protein